MAYLSSGISPSYGIFWAFLSWTIPFWIVVQIVLCCVTSSKYRLLQIIQFILLVLYLPFLWATYQPFGTNTLPTQTSSKAFSVLSYNVHVFNSYPILQQQKPHAAKEMRAWVTNNQAEIQCFQEFFNANASPEFDMIRQLAINRNYHYHASSGDLEAKNGYFGLIILSKFPIVRRGELPFEKRESNYQACIWADILHGKDTIRIINVHLESFILSGALDIQEILPALAKGFTKRAKQIELLTHFLAKTPYKTILTGDFNDLPYSYSYQALKRYLYNAFESCGAGFGTTHASVGNLPRIHIDNQFYGKGLKCTGFRTFYEQTSSDHAPIQASYEVP